MHLVYDIRFRVVQSDERERLVSETQSGRSGHYGFVITQSFLTQRHLPDVLYKRKRLRVYRWQSEGRFWDFLPLWGLT